MYLIHNSGTGDKLLAILLAIAESSWRTTIFDNTSEFERDCRPVPENSIGIFAFLLNGTMGYVEYSIDSEPIQSLDSFTSDDSRWRFVLISLIDYKYLNLKFDTCSDNPVNAVAFFDNHVPPPDKLSLYVPYNQAVFSFYSQLDIDALKSPETVQTFINKVWMEFYPTTLVIFENRLPSAFVVCNGHQCRVAGNFLSIMHVIAEKLQSERIQFFSQSRKDWNNAFTINYFSSRHLFHKIWTTKMKPK